MAEEMAIAYPDLHMTVTDVDVSMVEAARVRLADHANVTVLQADMTELAFEDQSFDVVCCYLMLHHVIEWKRAMSEAARVLRPGGTFIGYDMTKTWAEETCTGSTGLPIGWSRSTSSSRACSRWGCAT